MKSDNAETAATSVSEKSMKQNIWSSGLRNRNEEVVRISQGPLKCNITPWHFMSVQVLFWCYHDDRALVHATSCVVGTCDWDLRDHTAMFVWIKVIAEVSGQQIWNMSFMSWTDNTDTSILCHPPLWYGCHPFFQERYLGVGNCGGLLLMEAFRVISGKVLLPSRNTFRSPNWRTNSRPVVFFLFPSQSPT